MTTFTTRNRRGGSRGFTLVEIMLVIGLGAILAVVAIPSIEGWMAESRLSSKASELIGLVQAAKLQADEKGEAHFVVLLPSDEKAPKDPEPNVAYLVADDSVEWKLERPGPRGKPVRVSEIQVDSQGLVEPVTFRVSSGEKYVEYRFDFLTGHALSQGSSF